MTDYLPKDATIEQACAWLQAKTGQTWILPRLMECHLTPHFWLDYKPGYPVIFGGRIEGYQTRMMFQGDLRRLEADGADALVSMFAAHDGSLIKVEPGLRVPLVELRFKRADVERVAEIINKSKAVPASAPIATVKPVPRSAAQEQTILKLVQSLGYDPLNLPKNKPGKAGVKSAVRHALSNDTLFIGSTVFDKAWERLSANGEIVIQ